MRILQSSMNFIFLTLTAFFSCPRSILTTKTDFHRAWFRQQKTDNLAMNLGKKKVNCKVFTQASDLDIPVFRKICSSCIIVVISTSIQYGTLQHFSCKWTTYYVVSGYCTLLAEIYLFRWTSTEKLFESIPIRFSIPKNVTSLHKCKAVHVAVPTSAASYSYGMMVNTRFPQLL